MSSVKHEQYETCLTSVYNDPVLTISCVKGPKEFLTHTEVILETSHSFTHTQKQIAVYLY